MFQHHSKDMNYPKKFFFKEKEKKKLFCKSHKWVLRLTYSVLYMTVFKDLKKKNCLARERGGIHNFW